MGSRVSCFVFRVSRFVFEFRIEAVVLEDVEGSRSACEQNLHMRVQGLGFRVSGLGFRVLRCRG